MAQTIVTISTSNDDYTLPGTWEVQAVINSFSSTIPGIASMQADVNDEGDTRYITFRPRTGTKG